MIQILTGDALENLKSLPDESVNCCVTSPPYWGGLRDYGMEAQLGREKSPEEYVSTMVAVFREVKRALHEDGTLWLNIGDTYANGGNGGGGSYAIDGLHGADKNTAGRTGLMRLPLGYKPKDLIGIPWMVAFALRADGWYLRSDIIWAKPNCLSGGATVYARSQKGDMPMRIKDLSRLNPATVKLWNGSKWTKMTAIWKNQDPENKIEVRLRNGQSIGCTGDHLWPTDRGVIKASDLKIGDVISSSTLPQPEQPTTPLFVPDDLGWFIGVYLAEGSRSGDSIQISGHIDESERFEHLKAIANCYGATCTRHVTSEQGSTINLRSLILNGIIDTYIAGKTAHDKHLTNKCWRRSNAFLRSVLMGYLSGDGHFDEKNNRWRLGFCRNYYLADDLRTMGARLGISIRLKTQKAVCNGKYFPSFKGEVRMEQRRADGEVVEISSGKGREFWDISVEDDPHLFSLSSGILTHNCMPESVTDRPTRSHEYIFLLSKSKKYFYDADAIKEPCSESTEKRVAQDVENQAGSTRANGGAKTNGPMKAVVAKQRGHSRRHDGFNERWDQMERTEQCSGMRNKRDVWTVAPANYKEAHFATFPPELITPCVLAGCPLGGTVLDPFSGSGTTGQVAVSRGRKYIGIELNPEYVKMSERRLSKTQPGFF